MMRELLIVYALSSQRMEIGAYRQHDGQWHGREFVIPSRNPSMADAIRAAEARLPRAA